MSKHIGDLRYSPTRFESLFYAKVEAGLWSFFQRDGDGRKHKIGPHYATKAELLADLTRYATEFGLHDQTQRSFRFVADDVSLISVALLNYQPLQNATGKREISNLLAKLAPHERCGVPPELLRFKSYVESTDWRVRY